MASTSARARKPSARQPAGRGRTWRHAAIVSTPQRDVVDEALESPPRARHDFSRVPAHASPTVIQAKLRVDRPGDSYEREADRVASEVATRVSSGDRVAGPSPPGPDVPDHNRRPRIRPLSRGAGDQGGVRVLPAVEQSIARATSAGRPLPGEVRASMERVFLTDFARVRVHTGSEASTLAETLGARAFTTGRHVFVGRGEGVANTGPATPEGRTLLAHELTHVVQQSGQAGESSDRRIQRKTKNFDTTLLGGLDVSAFTDLKRELVRITSGLSHYNDYFAVGEQSVDHDQLTVLELLREAVGRARAAATGGSSEVLLDVFLRLNLVDGALKGELAAVRTQLAATGLQPLDPALVAGRRPLSVPSFLYPASPAAVPQTAEPSAGQGLRHRSAKSRDRLASEQNKGKAKKVAKGVLFGAKQVPQVGRIAKLADWVVKYQARRSTQEKVEALKALLREAPSQGVSAMSVESETVAAVCYVIAQKEKKAATVMGASVITKMAHSGRKDLGEKKGVRRKRRALDLLQNARSGDTIAIRAIIILLDDEKAEAVINDASGLEILAGKMKSK